MGPCDNPDVIEIEEVLPIYADVKLNDKNSKCCPMSLFIWSNRRYLRDDALFNIIGGLVKDQTRHFFGTLRYNIASNNANIHRFSFWLTMLIYADWY